MTETALSTFTTEEIQEELDRRRRIIPKANKVIDTRIIRKECVDYMNVVATAGYEAASRYKHGIFEKVIEAIYGSDVWPWINSHD